MPRRKKTKKGKESPSGDERPVVESSESEDIEPLKATLEKEVQRILKDRLGVTMTR